MVKEDERLIEDATEKADRLVDAYATELEIAKTAQL
jgi:hypothetical protein